jgi:acetylornithine deacetylase
MDKLAWLSRLIAFDTTSRNSNLELIENVGHWLKSQHLNSYLTYDPSKQKANLFATIPAHDNRIEGGLILSGHTDVVPVEGQVWETNPFVATQIEDKIYGRGACDMKGFIAVVLALIPEFQKLRLTQPIHLAFSYDEEVGCHGAKVLIKDLVKRGIKPKACIVGEPSNMRPIMAHKGVQGYRCRIHGRAAHSSLTPDGCNAIEYAARLINYIREFADELRQHGPFDDHYDVPFTSISTNTIQGGTADNIIPALCEFYFEFRYLPQVQPREIIDKIIAYSHQLLPEMQREYSDVSIEFDNMGWLPPFESIEEEKIVRWARRISGVKQIFKVAYATEAGLFQAAQIPTIVCGPGSIEQAHRPNEYITIEQLNQCEQFLLKLAQKFYAEQMSF